MVLKNNDGNILRKLYFLVFDVLFAEELGLVMEVASDAVDEVTGAFSEENAQCLVIGHSVADDKSVSLLQNFCNCNNFPISIIVIIISHASM